MEVMFHWEMHQQLVTRIERTFTRGGNIRIVAVATPAARNLCLTSPAVHLRWQRLLRRRQTWY